MTNPTTKTKETEAASESFRDMRMAVAEADALIAAARDLFHKTEWGGAVDARRVERIDHLIGASSVAAEEAILAVDRFDSAMSDAGLACWSTP